MAATRRSTRQAVAATPKYNEDSSPSENEAPKRKGAKATRQKRARDDHDEDVGKARFAVLKYPKSIGSY